MIFKRKWTGGILLNQGFQYRPVQKHKLSGYSPLWDRVIELIENMWSSLN
ncbi:hypothetical protein CMALT394_60048 [Carnobacterium maltaromaticum]|nr:hypothetical protein CMALT394_60048 [Carnobacterium maltaromaticum]